MRDWKKHCLSAGIFGVCAGQDSFRMLSSWCFNSLSCLCVTTYCWSRGRFCIVTEMQKTSEQTMQEALHIGDCLLWRRLRSKYLMTDTVSQTFMVTLGSTIKSMVLVLLFHSQCCWQKRFCSSVVNWIIKLLWIRTVPPSPSSFV